MLPSRDRPSIILDCLGRLAVIPEVSEGGSTSEKMRYEDGIRRGSEVP